MLNIRSEDEVMAEVSNRWLMNKSGDLMKLNVVVCGI